MRGKTGSLPWLDHGFSLDAIKEWPSAQHAAGLPDSLADFYEAHGLCLDCGGHSVQMIGWSAPRPGEVGAAEELNVEELPVYNVCDTCHGTGRSRRSQWRKKGH